MSELPKDQELEIKMKALRLDHHRVYQEAWESQVSAHVRAAMEAEKLAADFAKIGLQSAFLLNGGGLVFLPSIVQLLGKTQRVEVPANAWIFVAGLMFASVCALIAYVNYSLLARQRQYEAVANSIELNVRQSNDDPEAEPAFISASATERRVGKWVTRTALLAVGAALLSFGFFVFGALKFIAIVAHH